MSLQTNDTSLEQRIIQDRIQTFYGFLNEEQWQECFALIDPKLKDEGKITLKDFADSLSSFFAGFGPVENVAVRDVTRYPNVRDNKHDERDFAYAESVWTDRHGRLHQIQERWVKAADGYWYTRMVGLV